MSKAKKKKAAANKFPVKPRGIAKKSNPAVDKKTNGIQRSLFPIVGIGASAGGIEAFQQLLEELPANLGMAYVFVQHLSPDHQSYLPEILVRKTKMNVYTATHGMKVHKDTVYVIPPDNSITIHDGTLHLTKRSKDHRNFHPIDDFLTSLASAYKETAIGIILSGTATDGTLGLKAIKAEGGVTFSQDDTAAFPTMPHYPAEMGYVDFVMPPAKIAKELAALVRYPYAVITQNQFLDQHKAELRRIHMILHAKRNVDFSHYKQTTIQRRILRRMVLNHCKNPGEYAQILKDTPAEVDALYQDLLITVTNFFRDQQLYHSLTTRILPILLKNRKSNDPIRIWIPGCATGEEAVSFAIVILEFLGDKAITTPIQIFATDLNEKAIEKSRTGIYLKSAVQNVSPQRLKKFFVKTDGSYQVVKAIRDICIFAPHNLLKDPPFSRMDIISCQNVLIYLEAAPQNKIMHAFHYSLKPTGYLLLGKSETIGSATDLFEPLDKEHKIYSKKAVTTPLQVEFSVRNYQSPGLPPEDTGKHPGSVLQDMDLEKETEKILLNRYVPPSVLVNKDLEILRFRGSTARYLEPANGKASLHLMKMVKEEIGFALRTLIHRARKDEKMVKKEGLFIGTNGNTRELSIEIIPLKRGDRVMYFLIVFKEGSSQQTIAGGAPGPARTSGQKDKQILSLEKQLKEARDSIRIMSEDFEATREELQSANEEVLSSNEELQSINEELETSKEELQSTNEELTTINEELQNRNIELRTSSEYAEAILGTMHESLLILNDELRVKTANKGFYTTFKTTNEETEGFTLFELGNNQWDIPELRKQLRLLQSKNVQFANFEVDHVFPAIGRKTMLLNAQRVAVKEGSNSVILLAIRDVTGRKEIEERLKENEERFRLLIQNSYDIITVFDKNGIIKYSSPAMETILGYTSEERAGKNILTESIVHPADRKIKENMLKNSVQHPEQNVHAEFRLLHKDGSYRFIDAVCKNQINVERIKGIVATYRDVTGRKNLEQQKDEFISIASHELRTPIVAIKSQLQQLKQQLGKIKDEKSSVLAAKIETQTERVSTLLVDLIDFTHIESGKFRFRDDDYDLNSMIRETVEDMQNTTEFHTINTRLQRKIRLKGDRYRVAQVLTNLLSNAIKYSPDNKKINVSTEIANGQVTVSVQDFGIGIDADHLGNVFDRFFRVSEPELNTFQGLGLALYIAAEIVKRQGGKIWVNSTRGKGSTFYFTLPVKKK